MLKKERTDSLRGILLWLLCLTDLPMRQTDGQSRCSLESVTLVQDFLGAVRKMKSFDSRLYTPTIQDYEQKCPNSTLTCFAKEVKVLVLESRNEFSLPRRNLARQLYSLITQEEGVGCPHCEEHKEEAAEIFLERLGDILKMMNSQVCNGRTNTKVPRGMKG